VRGDALKYVSAVVVYIHPSRLPSTDALKYIHFSSCCVCMCHSWNIRSDCNYNAVLFEADQILRPSSEEISVLFHWFALAVFTDNYGQ